MWRAIEQTDWDRSTPFSRRVGAGPLFLALLLAFVVPTGFAATTRPMLEEIRVTADGRGFVRHPSGRAFQPWGFNYDHDESGRLLEDYWHALMAAWLEFFERERPRP